MCKGIQVLYEDCTHYEIIITDSCKHRGTDLCAIVAFEKTEKRKGKCSKCCEKDGGKKGGEMIFVGKTMFVLAKPR